MKDSDFVFDFVKFLHYKCHKINLNPGGWYRNSPNWIKKQKSNNESCL